MCCGVLILEGVVRMNRLVESVVGFCTLVGGTGVEILQPGEVVQVSSIHQMSLRFYVVGVPALFCVRMRACLEIALWNSVHYS